MKPLPALAALTALSLPTSLHADSATDALVPPLELPAVRVEGQAPAAEELPGWAPGHAGNGYRLSRVTAGPLGEQSTLDIPFSVQATSTELAETRGAHTVSDAVWTNPAVATLMESSGYSTLSRLMVRGFTAADQSDLRDGLVDRSFTYVPLENVERVEVMNGLSGFLQGFSALGGTIHYVSKQPTERSTASLAAGQYGGGIDYVHLDAGGTVGKDGQKDGKGGQLGYRVNAYQEDGSTTIFGSHQKRSLLSALLRWRLSETTTVTFDGWRQDLDMHGLATYFNVNPAAGVPVPSAGDFSAERQYGQDWTYNKSRKTVLGAALESRLNNVLSLRAAYRHGIMDREYLYVAAALTDTAGNYTEKAYSSPRQDERTRSYQALVDANLGTGPLAHTATFGFVGTDYLYSRGDDVSAALGNSNTYGIAVYDNPRLTLGPTNVWYEQYFRNLLVSDRITFAPHWSLLLGLARAQVIQTRWGTGSTLATANYDQSKLTPSLALMFKPVPYLATYASYMEGIVNGGTAPKTADNAYAMLSPSTSRQYEVGAKAELRRFSASVALYRIDKVNEYVDPSDNLYKQDGREVHQGLEAYLSGKPVDALVVVGGISVLHAEIARARNNPSLEGKAPINVPPILASVHLEAAPPGQRTIWLTGGVRYSGKRYVDAANTDALAGAAIYEVGAKASGLLSGHRMSAHFSVQNLLNTGYWSYYRSGDGLLLGAPRVYTFSAKVEL
jgi:iron complex outermembrane receptor protein